MDRIRLLPLALLAAASGCSGRFRVTQWTYEEVALSADGGTLSLRYAEETVEHRYGVKSYRRPLASSRGTVEVPIRPPIAGLSDPEVHSFNEMISKPEWLYPDSAPTPPGGPYREYSARGFSLAGGRAFLSIRRVVEGDSWYEIWIFSAAGAPERKIGRVPVERRSRRRRAPSARRA